MGDEDRVAGGAQADFARHMRLQHAMQSGVASDLASSGPEDPKHLRVGVNTALTDAGSLVRLLIAKGVITEAEVAKALADGMAEEVARYEAMLSKRLGTKVTLA